MTRLFEEHPAITVELDAQGVIVAFRLQLLPRAGGGLQPLAGRGGAGGAGRSVATITRWPGSGCLHSSTATGSMARGTSNACTTDRHAAGDRPRRGRSARAGAVAARRGSSARRIAGHRCAVDGGRARPRNHLDPGRVAGVEIERRFPSRGGGEPGPTTAAPVGRWWYRHLRRDPRRCDAPCGRFREPRH